MSVTAAVAIWATVVAVTAFAGIRIGLSGPRFGVALATAALLFGFELFFAVPRVREQGKRWLGARAGILAPLVPLFAALIYSFAVTTDWKLMLASAAYVVVPSLLLASSAGKVPGAWEDYAALAVIWLPVEFRWMYRMFPYPPQLTHTLTILLGVSTAVAAFVLLRRLEGVGYAAEWRRGFGWNFALHYFVFIAIAIPVGIKIGFLTFGPAWPHLRASPFSATAGALFWAAGVLLFTAWPEEFLFRGLLQNLLTRTFKNEWAALAVASVIFGLSHIFHAPYPNWKYVALATIAGLFYGHAWMRTRSLVPGVLVHALVDISWHLLFR
jgi:uncharacterized protein